MSGKSDVVQTNFKDKKIPCPHGWGIHVQTKNYENNTTNLKQKLKTLR